jgi:hypothetical protein
MIREIYSYATQFTKIRKMLNRAAGNALYKRKAVPAAQHRHATDSSIGPILVLSSMPRLSHSTIFFSLYRCG